MLLMRVRMQRHRLQIVRRRVELTRCALRRLSNGHHVLMRSDLLLSNKLQRARLRLRCRRVCRGLSVVRRLLLLLLLLLLLFLLLLRRLLCRLFRCVLGCLLRLTGRIHVKVLQFDLLDVVAIRQVERAAKTNLAVHLADNFVGK